MKIALMKEGSIGVFQKIKTHKCIHLNLLMNRRYRLNLPILQKLVPHQLALPQQHLNPKLLKDHVQTDTDLCLKREVVLVIIINTLSIII